MKRNEDWKERLHVVYSTDPDYQYEYVETEEEETPDPGKQELRVFIERKNRGGKVVTVIKGFVGAEKDIKELSNMIKGKCGVGGSVKDGEIIIQGDLRDKIILFLKDRGYIHTR